MQNINENTKAKKKDRRKGRQYVVRGDSYRCT